MIKSLSNVSLLDILPPNLLEDKKVYAAAKSLDKSLKEVDDNIELVLHLPRLDKLPSEVLDSLAWQFHVDFYEGDLDLETKRNLIRESVAWHKIKGTPAAVKMLLDGVFQESEVIEWFDYDGKPFRFKVRVSGLKNIDDDFEKIYRIIDAGKNLRSHLESLEIDITPKKKINGKWRSVINNLYFGVLKGEIGYSSYQTATIEDKTLKKYFGVAFIKIGSDSFTSTSTNVYKTLNKYIGAYFQQGGNFTYLCNAEDMSQIDLLSTAMVDVLIVDRGVVREGEIEVEIIPVEELYNSKEYFGGSTATYYEIKHNPQILDKKVRVMNSGAAMALIGYSTYMPATENVYKFNTNRYFGGLNAVIGEFKYFNGDEAKAPEKITINIVKEYESNNKFGGGIYQRNVLTMKPAVVETYRDEGSYFGSTRMLLGSETYLNGDEPDRPPKPWIIRREKVYSTENYFGGTYREYFSGQMLADCKQKEKYQSTSEILLAKAEFSKLTMRLAQDVANSKIGNVGGSLAFVKRVERYNKNGG